MKKLVVMMLSCAALQAQATTLQYKDVNTLVNEADGVVTGTVTHMVSQRAEDKALYTYVTLGDVKVIGGRYDGGELTLMLSGGYDGERGLDVEGSPRFEVAERVALLVAGNGQRMVPVSGWGQGVFRFRKDDAGNDIVTDDAGNEIYNVTEKGEVIKADQAPAAARLVDAKGLAVKSAMADKFGAGQTDDGSAVTVVRVAPVGKPMSGARFLELLSKRAQARTYAVPMQSVAIGQALRLSPDDVGKKGATTGASGRPAEPAGGNAEPADEK